MRKHILTSFLLTFSLTLLIPQFAIAESSPVLAVVNREKIDRARLHLYLLMQGIAEEDWEQSEKQMLEQLVDRTLIRQFLDSRKITAPKATLERQLALIEKVLKSGESPEEILKKLGMTRKDLEKELSLPLAWRRYVRQITVEKEIENYFKKHRIELDGTRREAKQIFFKVAADADKQKANEAINKLAEIKNQIERGEFTFAEAARKYSQSPSAKQGGDLGTFAFTGQMPVAIATQVFQTDVKKISNPFSSKFGVHLIYVEKEIPGLFNLEDARAEIINRIVEVKWKQNVRRLRKSAKLEYGSAK